MLLILKYAYRRIAIRALLMLWAVLLCDCTCFSQSKKNDAVSKFTFEAGPEISIPAGSFEYAGSMVGLGMKAQLNDNVSERWTIDVYADYHTFFGSLKEEPKPPYRPRMLSFRPGIKYYFFPALFVAFNIGVTGMGGVDKSGLKGCFSYNPSLGISIPSHSRRVNITLGYVHIVDSPQPTGYVNAGVKIRIF